MTDLADSVLPLIRTRSDLHRLGAANAHGVQMHAAVTTLEEAAASEDPKVVFSVTQKAIASATKVIMRADDSSGIIGHACRRLLALHPQAAVAAVTSPARLVDWMIAFQFDNVCDFFTIDPVDYAPALGARGVATYRSRLEEIRTRLGPQPEPDSLWSSAHSHDWFTIEWNDQRLAVLDRDVDEIIRTHSRDRKVAAWIEDTAKALEEIGELDLAIDWAQQAVEHPGGGHQSMDAARYWCRLLAEHRPEEELEGRWTTFRRWPTADHAAHLRTALGGRWVDHQDEVMTALADRPGEAVGFALRTLQDLALAWDLAHSLDLTDTRLWSDLLDAYEKLDPIATLPVHRRMVADTLTVADAKNYRYAARRLARMRKLAADTPAAPEVDTLVAELREANRNRPRLQREFTKAGLP